MFTLLRSNRDVRRLFIGDNISIMGDFLVYRPAGLVKDFTDSPLVAFVYVAFTCRRFSFSACWAVADKLIVADTDHVFVVASIVRCRLSFHG